MKKGIFIMTMCLGLFSAMKAQDYQHKWFVKGGAGIGFGLNTVELKRNIIIPGVEDFSASVAMSPGGAVAPYLAIGKNIYENLSLQMSFYYNLNYTYEANYSSYGDAVEMSYGFSRFGFMLEGNYYITIIEDKWAMVPNLGLGLFIPGDLFFKSPSYEQVVSYDAAPSFKAGLEFQKSWKGKFSIGFGGYYQVENYKANEVRFGTVDEQDANVRTLNASNFGVNVSLIYPIIHNTKQGHMKNVFSKPKRGKR